MKKLFNNSVAVFFDIDGVLKKGNTAIPGAKDSLIKLRKRNVQFGLITNAGGDLEKNRAKKLNEILELNKDYEIKENELFLCHTPLRGLVNSYKNKKILITGIGDIENIMSNYGYRNFITVDEYCQIYNKILPYFLAQNQENSKLISNKELIQKLSHRFDQDLFNSNDFNSENSYNYFSIDSIFVLTDVTNWEKNIQIMCDLIISQKGIPGTIDLTENQFVDCVFAAYDINYKDQFILNRIGLGGFIRSLEHLYKIQYNKNIKYKLIGKPASLIFDYAKSTVENINSKTLYMVGDNPEVDIQGGKNAGIKTILLKTGVHNKPENSTEYAADYFVDDVSKAVDLILKNHNL